MVSNGEKGYFGKKRKYWGAIEGFINRVGTKHRVAKGINPVEESSGKVKLYCHIGHTS